MLGATEGEGRERGGIQAPGLFASFNWSLFVVHYSVVQRSASHFREAQVSYAVLRVLPEADRLPAVIDDAIHYRAE